MNRLGGTTARPKLDGAWRRSGHCAANRRTCHSRSHHTMSRCSVEPGSASNRRFPCGDLGHWPTNRASIERTRSIVSAKHNHSACDFSFLSPPPLVIPSGRSLASRRDKLRDQRDFLRRLASRRSTSARGQSRSSSDDHREIPPLRCGMTCGWGTTGQRRRSSAIVIGQPMSQANTMDRIRSIAKSLSIGSTAMEA